MRRDADGGSIGGGEGRVMTKLIALLVLAGAVAAGVFYWRKNDESRAEMWSSTKDTMSSWSKTVADETGKAGETVAAAADTVTNAASQVADEAKGAASE
jgi:hypothetical protein